MARKQQQRLTIYVEGSGGASRQQIRAFENAFKKFLLKAGFPADRFDVSAGGGRTSTYDDYCIALREGKPALLLVDSEELVTTNARTGERQSVWQHLATRPDNALPQPTEEAAPDAHLMVPTMEAWLLADLDEFKKFYKGDFNREELNENLLPRTTDYETLTKKQIEDAIEKATSVNKKKGMYTKGEHQALLLERVHPQYVAQKSYHARRFFCHLKELLKAALTWTLDCSPFASTTP